VFPVWSADDSIGRIAGKPNPSTIFMTREGYFVELDRLVVFPQPAMQVTLLGRESDVVCLQVADAFKDPSRVVAAAAHQIGAAQYGEKVGIL